MRFARLTAPLVLAIAALAAAAPEARATRPESAVTVTDRSRPDTTFSVVAVEAPEHVVSMKIENVSQCSARLVVLQRGEVLKRLELSPLTAKRLALVVAEVGSPITVDVTPLGCSSNVSSRYVVEGRVPSSAEYLVATIASNPGQSEILPRRP